MTLVSLLSRAAVLLLMVLLGGCAGLPEIQSEQQQVQDTSAEPSSLAAQLRMQRDQFAASRTNATRTERANFARVHDLLAQQDIQQAVRTCNDWLAMSASASQSYVICGDAYQASNSEEAELAAVSHYQLALQINPHNYYAHNRLAGVLRTQGRFEHALTHYNQAIAAWPGFAPAYRNRAILNDLYIGDKAAALQDYQTYQLLHTDAQGEASRQIKGWIADLTRQIQNSTEVARHVEQ